MKNLKIQIVNAETYQSEINRINKNSFLMLRKHHYEKLTTEIDTFANFWSFAFAEIKPGNIWIWSNDKEIELNGYHAIFFPIQNIIEWRLSAGLHIWNCLISESLLPDWVPQKPVLYSFKTKTDFKNFKIESEKDVFNFIKNNSSGINCEKNETRNPIALRLKKKIDLEYLQKKSISNYAEELGISHEVMTRYFKKCFGLSPHEYRNKMRLMQIMVDLVLKPQRVSMIYKLFGFEDASHFNEQFKKVLRTIPSDFKAKNSELDIL